MQKKLIQSFNDKVFDIIDLKTEKLSDVAGIGNVRALRIT
jgi:DNA integrity scanning protein DisA with diadenylate cyclase activity